MLLTAKLELRQSGGQQGLFARAPLEAGERLIHFQGTLGPAPSRFSLQVGMGLHLHGQPDQPEEFLNHACEPNCYIEFDTLTLRTLRAVPVDEEVTFNYLTTEWDFRAPFQCGCGSPRCFGHLRGYRHLDAEQRRRLEPWVAPFLRGAGE